MARSPRWASIASLIGCVAALCSVACDRAEIVAEIDVPVRLDRVAIDAGDSPILVLQEEGGPRWLPIWVGIAEAHSIALEIEERRLPRPNTHDLARSVIRRMKGRVVSVVVTELREGTYYALLKLDVDGEPIEIDARPSDAIAIALRDDAPIFVREGLFQRADGSGESPQDDSRSASKQAI
jgi:bifunctional DNase/RNase